VDRRADRVDVSVLIPVLNEEAHIRDAAAMMLAQCFEGSVEYLFIDGGSRDRTVEILGELQRADPRLRRLENPRRTTPVALNIGLSEARGEYVARMDAHTLYPKDYLAHGVARLRRGGAAHVSGPQVAHGVGPWSRRIARALNTRLGTGSARFRHPLETEIEIDSGFTGVWPRSVLEAHGGWDEEWINDQDSELAARIRGRGGRILCLPEMEARYIPRDSLRALARQYWRYGVYRAKTSGAHPESMRRSHLLPPGLALSLTASILPLPGLRPVARAALGLWCAAVLGVTAAEGWRPSAETETAEPADIAALPAVFGAMHLAWGFGFIAGCVRFGPPLRALAHVARSSVSPAGVGRPVPPAPAFPPPSRFRRLGENPRSKCRSVPDRR
jgi:succinoglycan biosynthesis protein ExoA